MLADGKVMEFTCADCRHWRGSNTHRGLCRRYAPRATIVIAGSDGPELGAVWPLTLASDVCGDWFPLDSETHPTRGRFYGPWSGPAAVRGHR